MEYKKEILDLKPVSFKKRFFKTLVVPSVFLWVGILCYLSLKNSFFWMVTGLFIVGFMAMNFKAMIAFITKIEVYDQHVEFEYLSFDKKKKIAIPINELTVECYGNGIGFSSLVSNHLRIEKKGNILLKQYKADDWTSELMKSIETRLNKKTLPTQADYPKSHK